MHINPLRPEDSQGFIPNEQQQRFIDAALDNAQRLGLDAEYVYDDVVKSFAHSEPLVELSAAEILAEHTGHDEYVLADKIADRLADVDCFDGGYGVQLTSGQRALIADTIREHRNG